MCSPIVLSSDGILTVCIIYLSLTLKVRLLNHPLDMRKVDTNENGQHLHKNNNLVLAIDVMIVSGIPFLITLSRYIHFVKVVALPNQSKKSIMKSPNEQHYQLQGQRVHISHHTRRWTI